MADLNNEKRPSIKLILRDFRHRLFHSRSNPSRGWPENATASRAWRGELSGKRSIEWAQGINYRGIQGLAVLLPSLMPVKALMLRSTIYLMKKTMRVKWST